MAGRFTVCPTAVRTPTCKLQPLEYTAAVHDPFRFSIAEAGWQEERADAGEFATMVVLSRIDSPGSRLTFLSGETGAATPATLDPAAFDLPGFKAGPPGDVTISGTPAKYIDVEPAGAQAASAVNIEGQTIPVQPDHAYRFTVSRIPMGDEAATLIMVSEAPTNDFATFVTMADRVLRTVRY